MVEPKSYDEYKHEHEESVRPFLEAIYKGNLMLWGALTFRPNHVTSPYLAQALSEQEGEIEEAEANNNYDYANELKRYYQKTIDLYSIPKHYKNAREYDKTCIRDEDDLAKKHINPTRESREWLVSELDEGEKSRLHNELLSLYHLMYDMLHTIEERDKLK